MGERQAARGHAPLTLPAVIEELNALVDTITKDTYVGEGAPALRLAAVAVHVGWLRGRLIEAAAHGYELTDVHFRGSPKPGAAATDAK